ncbi:uncharacterized protein [Anabrus simplex]|uniref:uncharacterized protein n=1 Tax=Anabrus simplex TaxID=316456 RepID=UPI0035A383DA
MSPYGYVQLFLFGLLCTGAVSAETANCSYLQAQSNIDMNQVYGDWFLGKAKNSANLTKSQCFPISIKKSDETTFDVTANYSEFILHQRYTIKSTENAGTWQAADGDRSELVIFLSTDGSIMALANCVPNPAEFGYILLSKHLPITSEKIEEFRLAVENAGISGQHLFTWESEAVCPSA